MSIFGGRIIHYCSAACREAHLRPADGPEPGEIGEAIEDPHEEDLTAEGEPEPGEDRAAAARPAFRARASAFRPAALLPHGIAILVLVGLGVAIAALPWDWLRGLLLPGIAGLGALAALAFDIIDVRRQGIARLVEAAAIPLAACALAAVSAMQSGARLPAAFAVALLLAERIGRVVELTGRTRSGVVEVLQGAPPLLLASEWRDNSAIAARIRRVTLVLEWARFPLAALLGLAAWLLGASGPAALLTGAIALVAVNTRALRMATGDAHLSVALAAARRGLVIRDAHAVDRVGAVRMILFMSRRALVLPRLKVIDWRTVGEVDEGAVLAALSGIEARVQGRIAEAVAELAASRGVASREVEEVDVRSGKGVTAQTPYGHLLCGSRALLLDELVSTAEHEGWAATVEQSGRRALFVAIDGRVVAMFAVEEEPVPGVQEVTRGLLSLGLEPAMITSAEVDAAQALGARLGIENVRFETAEERLGAVLPDITGTGDTVLLVGHGPEFEKNLRSATAGFALGSDEPTMAGVDARKQGIEEVLRLVRSAREARRSVRVNLVSALIAALAGMALAVTWQSPTVAAFVCALGCAAAALATFNGPYPLLERLRARAGRIYQRVLRLVGVKRTAAP